MRGCDLTRHVCRPAPLLPHEGGLLGALRLVLEAIPGVHHYLLEVLLQGGRSGGGAGLGVGAGQAGGEGWRVWEPPPA